MLKKALSAGFIITNFRNYHKFKNRAKKIILRHDIDFTLVDALKIAQIENEIGIKATYFIRTQADYNIFQKDNYLILGKILKFGHEIGLHFEARLLAKIFRTDPVELFLKEKKLLEDCLNIKIISAAEHSEVPRPKNFWNKHFLMRVDKKRVGIEHYPQEKQYENLHYISDSGHRWKEGCLCQNLSKYSGFQLLTHPVHWDPKLKSLPKDYFQVMAKYKKLID